MVEQVSSEELDRLESLSNAVSAQVWTSWWEGRDGLSFDSFIMSGEAEKPNAERGPDIYISLDGHGPSPEPQDLIAAARTALPSLIAEIRRLRQRLECNDR